MFFTAMFLVFCDHSNSKLKDKQCKPNIVM